MLLLIIKQLRGSEVNGMSSNPTGVKNYQMIRDYLSWIYLYGYFSREDFEKLLPKKTASFDVCITYIKDIYPELINGRFRGKKKYLLLDRAAQPSDEDRLANTFFMRSLLDNELRGVLRILQELAREPARASSVSASVCVEESSASASSINRWLTELLEFGYVEKGPSMRFSVRIGPLRKLTNEELTDLYRYIKYCGNFTYPRIPARYLLRSVEREFLYRGLPLTGTSYFRFLNNPNHSIMDEDLVLRLLSHMQNREKVVLSVQRSGKKQKQPAIPACLRIDRRLGRWYLLSLEEDRPTMRRLTRLQDVTPAGSCTPEEWDQARAVVTDAFADSGFSGNLPKNGPTELQFELQFENPGIERQFLRELRRGTVKTENGRRIYHDQINDPVELVPLLRSYSPWLKPKNPDGLAERRIREDLLRMRQQLSKEVAE